MSILKNAIKSVDPAPEKKADVEFALNTLYDLAEAKTELFRSQLNENLRTAGTGNNQSIPITHILGWHNENRAFVHDGAGGLVDKVTGAIKKFVAGGGDNIIDGIGELFTTGLEAILGSGSGSQGEKHTYYIVVQGLSIVRFDISFWYKHIQVQGITDKIEYAMAFQGVQSSVDVDAITFNTFLQAYKKQLEAMKMDQQELKAYIRESKEIFELLRDDSAVKAQPRALGSAPDRPRNDLVLTHLPGEFRAMSEIAPEPSAPDSAPNLSRRSVDAGGAIDLANDTPVAG